MTPQRSIRGMTGSFPPLLRSRSRTRWSLFVILNVGSYILALGFFEYLRTGHGLTPAWPSLREDIRLGWILLEPISIFTHPWMILVMGMTLTVLLTVPIVMAVMYRLMLALILALLPAVMLHTPMLSLTVIMGVLLAGRTRLRRDYPLIAALLGMLPPILLLGFTTHLAASLLPPLQQWLAMGVLLVGLGVIILMIVLVLQLARLLKFQPGVLWPVLLLLPTAMGIFYFQIGPAELQYELLRKQFSDLQTANLQDIEISEDMSPDTLLEERKAALLAQLNAFLKAHPKSNRAPEILFLGGQTACLQIDHSGAAGPGVKLTSRFTLPASSDFWKKITESHPHSPQNALALWRQAELLLLQASRKKPKHAAKTIEQAKVLLQKSQPLLTDVLRRRIPPQVSGDTAFRQQQTLPGQDEYRHADHMVAERLWLIQEHQSDFSPQAAWTLARLAAVNPYKMGTSLQLKNLSEDPACAATNLKDNILLTIAMNHRDLYKRAKKLQALAADEQTDAAIQANYELGRIAMQTAAAKLIRMELKPPQYYFRIVRAAKDNPWQNAADEHLHWLDLYGDSSDNPASP